MLRRLFRIDLRHVILWMSLFFVILALANGLHAAYQVQRDVMLEHHQEKNQTNVERLAQVTETFLVTSTNFLETAALDITESGLDPAAAQRELDQLANVTDAFNAFVAVDASGKIFASRPKDDFLIGSALTPHQSPPLLEGHSPIHISQPFIGPKNLWYILIARPIFSPEKLNAGMVAGVIQLGNGNALQKALSKYHYQDGSYFYIVDDQGMIIYHPDNRLIGTYLANDKSLHTELRANLDAKHATGAISTTEIVSFAQIPSANWTLIATRPIDVLLSPITDLLWRTTYYSLPLFLLSVLAIWWSARLIARPLHELADVAANIDNQATFSRIRFINGWYVEAALIQKALMRSVSAIGNRMQRLHREGSTDPLTGVDNRRGLEAAITALMQEPQEVAVVMLDIDHFKSVNDTHGHAVGDEVLKTVTAYIKDTVRKGDVVARMGGEEFAILLPGADLASAQRFAERLRLTIEQAYLQGKGYVTVSLGIACYPIHGADIQETLHQADTALYRAKATGRNRVCLAGTDTV